jgi:hypothetical protein
MSKLRVFIVYKIGNPDAARLRQWLRRYRGASAVEPILLAETTITGALPAELERFASICDAAIVLGGADDLVQSSKRPRDRWAQPRPNVLLETGWFWARLGMDRVLLLTRGTVTLPSDIRSFIFHGYRELRDVYQVIRRFIEELAVAGNVASTSVEVLDVSPDFAKRQQQYDEVFDSAEKRIVLTATGMRHHRATLRSRLDELRSRRKITFEMYVPDLRFLERVGPSILAQLYRADLLHDRRTLERELKDCERDYADLVRAGRLRVIRIRRLFTFTAVVADPGQLGSLMLAEVILGRGATERRLQRPRFFLRRRISGGLYDCIWNALAAVISDRSPHLMP